MTRSMPAQKPGRSEQVVCTPRDFLEAVAKRFGPIRVDLAATAENRVAPIHFGPGSEHGEDSLKVHWHHFGGNLFCNPPFGRIDPWVEKATAEAKYHARVLMLLPASVGSDWFAEHVFGKALVLALRPRITFVNHSAPYPKDTVLVAWGPYVAPGFDLWRWKGEG